jgi:hypothetical protein
MHLMELSRSTRIFGTNGALIVKIRAILADKGFGKIMRGRFNSFALIGLVALPGAQQRAAPLPAVHDLTYSVAQPDTTSVPSTNPSQISVVTAQSDTSAIPRVGARVITSDRSALALQTAFTVRSGKSLEPQVAANGAAGSDEHENSWLDLILMLCITLGLFTYPLIRRQTALRQSSKLAS